MSILKTPLGDKALKLYTISGILMGIVLFVSSYIVSLEDYSSVQQGILYFAGSTILFIVIIPLLGKGGYVESRGDIVKALLIGAFSYYIILYIVWSSLYQLKVALS